MKNPIYRWETTEGVCEFELVFVRGTRGNPYRFGEGAATRFVHVPDFFLGRVPVTQALWTHVMGTNPSLHPGMNLPLENVSWIEIARKGGFLDRLSEGPIGDCFRSQTGSCVERFRLPTETEWEYAARGGKHWRDGYAFSGGNEIDALAWYDRRHGDHTQPVALKAPNQLGLHDMSGNIWEWCQDVFTRDVAQIPGDGTPHVGPGEERVLRGGCFHNWPIHCTVSKRYEIGAQFHDGCIGFRVAMSATCGSGT